MPLLDINETWMGYISNFYVLPGIIIFGFVLNILSFLVMCKPHNRTKSSGFYIAALALFDNFALIASLNHKIIKVNHNLISCQVVRYSSIVATNCSGWLIVAMTYDRYIAIKYPFEAVARCTLSKARRTTCFLLLIILVINSSMIWTFKPKALSLIHI